jgi:hypothetical protein
MYIVCTCTVYESTCFSVVQSEGAVGVASQEVIGLSMRETQTEDITNCIYKIIVHVCLHVHLQYIHVRVHVHVTSEMKQIYI